MEDDSEYEFGLRHYPTYKTESDKRERMNLKGTIFSFAAERPEKRITAKRKQVVEREKVRGKGNLPARKVDSGQILRKWRGQSEQNVLVRMIGHDEPKLQLKPAKEQVPHVNELKEAGNSTSAKEDLSNLEVALKGTQNSPISAHVDPLHTLDQVLSSKVELVMREVLNVSHELANLLRESINLQSNTETPTTTIGLMYYPESQGLLIKVDIECDGWPVRAIIDTRSQLNIVSSHVARSVLMQPVDMDAVITMNDANGGEARLHGLIENVPLDFGSIRTSTNFYVGEKVPFDMLLGRPWQCGYHVAIQEDEDGSYLAFKDPYNTQKTWHVLVTPDVSALTEWDYDAST